MTTKHPTIHLGECVQGMQNIADGSIDCILTDPPYLYLKNQKLDIPFDEQMFFAQCKRVLKKDGFIVLFGRGTSFYRWNTILDDLGFKFKEEIVWDKRHISSPLMAMSRVHETISIHAKGKGTINRVRVPYIEMKGHDIDAIVADIKRLKSVLNNTKSFDAVLGYLNDNEGKVSYNSTPRYRNRVSTRGDYRKCNRCVSVLNGITKGMCEKTIIRQVREHYATIHPTQKPVGILERLLALVTKEDDMVLDPFSGSGSTAVACINTDRQFVGYEIDKEYHALATTRIENVLSLKDKQLKLPLV